MTDRIKSDGEIMSLTAFIFSSLRPLKCYSGVNEVPLSTTETFLWTRDLGVLKMSSISQKPIFCEWHNKDLELNREAAIGRISGAPLSSLL